MGSVSRKQPLYGQLVDLLCQKIDNEMEPGDMLPSERDLSETYGLSRTTVRLAMRELEDMGLVTRRHGKGTFVACFSRSHKPHGHVQLHGADEEHGARPQDPRA